VCPASTVRERLWFVAREPFFQFIVLGFLIWTAVDYWNAHHDRHTIHLGRAERHRIVSAYLQQFGQPPTPEQLRGLLDRYVLGEIFLREGFALNLQKDDEIVRRRIVQKYEFLQTDLTVPDSPGPGVLERWFEQNKLRYLTPDRIAFAHVYFSPDRGGDIAAKVEVHEMATKDGVMTMRPLDKGLVIEPGKTVKLAPGGYHLMLMDLKGPLKQGDKVPLALQFEKAGKVNLSFDVQAVGAQAPGGGDHSGGHDMTKMPGHSGMKM